MDFMNCAEPITVSEITVPIIPRQCRRFENDGSAFAYSETGGDKKP